MHSHAKDDLFSDNLIYDPMLILKDIDPEIAVAIAREEERQLYKLEMIASENFVSPAVRIAVSSVMTNKYAEGYPEHRYYGGCEFVDVAEELARKRALELFDAEYVNVQPHSGSQANMAVYFSVLQPGDTILGMNLNHGGHLTHGSPVSFSGRFYNVISYGVNRDTEELDYDEILRLAKECRPKIIVSGASAYSRYIDFEAFSQIARETGAYLMVDMAHIAGLIAAGEHPSPIGYADFITTTTHKTLRGPRGGMIFTTKEFAKKIDSEIFPGIQGGPLMHIIAGKAVAFKEALTSSFKDYQRQVKVNAGVLCDGLKSAGLRIVSGGTDNHLMLVDCSSIDMNGRDAAELLDMAGITVNKNTIPFDPAPPRISSGIRLGTAAVTTRGMKEEEMEIIAGFILKAIENRDNKQVVAKILKDVREFCSGFPLHQSVKT